MANLLITGGAGFIGANFAGYWLQHNETDRVVVLDALTYAGNQGSLEPHFGKPQFRFVHGDILDTEFVNALLQEEAIDTIVHFAAESHVDRSILGPAAFIDTNIVGTHNLLQAAKSCWLDSEEAPSSHRFHHVSTDEVYGSLSETDPGFSEATPYSPNSPYAASKASSDHLVRAYHHTFGLETTVSNCSNNYGPYQFPEKLIPLMVVNALTGKALPIYGDGSNIRDWLYVEDHVRAIESVIKNGRVGESYNIGGNEERANIDLVNTICSLVDQHFATKPELRARFPDAPAAKGEPTNSLLTFVTDRPGHDWRYAIDATKVKMELGFEPKFDFEAGLNKTLNWMLDNEDWWRRVMDGSYREWITSQYEPGSV